MKLIQFFCCLLISFAFAASSVGQRPNFVFFLVDDLGWADPSCFGSPFYETPNIDNLCESGMKFTRAYAASPVCSPTRASILTGKHPVRVDITDWIPGRRADRVKNAIFRHIEDRDNLALEEKTIAENLLENGYATFFAGKWHLGDRGHFPKDQGFEFNIGGNHKGSPPGGYYSPWKNPTLKSNSKNEYLTERLTEESIKFIDSVVRNEDPKPFLLYISYYNVHTPITPYKKKINQFRLKSKKSFESKTPVQDEHEGVSRGRQDNANYASMIAAVDDSVGRVVNALKNHGLDDETVIFFFSDNGGLATLGNRPGPTSNLPLRSGKGWLYEGGIRVPMIIRLPGSLSGSESNVPVSSNDFYPTMLELAGIANEDAKDQDGVSLVPLLRGKQSATLENRALYWHYPHYHGSAWKPGAAILEGGWKLIEFYHYAKFELYDLKNDPGERKDLASIEPAKARLLRDKLKKWQVAMGAKMPERIEKE